MSTIDSEYRHFEAGEGDKPESPAESLLKSADFWEKRVGNERFRSSYIITQLLRRLAREQDDLVRMAKADPSERCVVVAQDDKLFTDDEGSIFFPDIERALYFLALSSKYKPIPPSLIYRIRNKGIANDKIYCVTPEIIYRKREIFTLYPIPQRIFEGTL